MAKQEHSACGTGVVARLGSGGQPAEASHEVVEQVLEISKGYVHRGAVTVDGKTGDGAGIILEIDKDFFKNEFAKLGPEITADSFGVGSFFLPKSENDQPNPDQETAKRIIHDALDAQGLQIHGDVWRNVPMDDEQVGDIAREAKPDIMQIAFLPKDGEIINHDELKIRAYRAQRAIENAFVTQDIPDAYLTSLTPDTIVYKGLMQSDQLTAYDDLNDPDYQSRFGMIHSRFSTNTQSTWQGAHPYPNGLEQNGEINTIKGNQLAWETRMQELGYDDFSSRLSP